MSNIFIKANENTYFSIWLDSLFVSIFPYLLLVLLITCIPDITPIHWKKCKHWLDVEKTKMDSFLILTELKIKWAKNYVGD